MIIHSGKDGIMILDQSLKVHEASMVMCGRFLDLSLDGTTEAQLLNHGGWLALTQMISPRQVSIHFKTNQDMKCLGCRGRVHVSRHDATFGLF
jgi:hypothetical protein